MPKLSLRTINSRRAIPAGTKQYIAPLPEPGLAVTYRRSKSLPAGNWFARKHREGTTKYDFYPIGAADDVQPANGTTVFSYEQAVREAEKWNAHETGVVLINKAYCLRDLANDYLAHQELTKRKPPVKMKRRIENNILPTLGDIPLRKLTHHQVENWFHTLAKSLPRKRDGQNREIANVDDEEYRRKRQATANTTWNLLRAMLNYGYKQGKVSSRAAWDRVQSFKAVSEPKVVEVSNDEVAAVIAACELDFQRLASAALYTAARYSELCRMKVRDFNPRTNKVFLPKTKNYNSRYVLLNPDALGMTLGVTASRQGVCIRPVTLLGSRANSVSTSSATSARVFVLRAMRREQ
jgi:integrase